MSEITVPRIHGAAPLIGPPYPHIMETDVKGELSLYDPKAEKVLVLNGSGSDVWLLCDGEQTADGIVDLLASAYRTDPSLIRPEVLSAIHRFVEEGFLPAL